MPATRSVWRCQTCGSEQPRWVGQCPACRSWGTVLECAARPAARNGSAGRVPATRPARPITAVPLEEVERLPTGIGELDRVLGGGLVPGATALLGGEPGVGKSTLLLQAAQGLAAAGRSVLYVAAEESAGQVRLRAERLGALHPRLLVAAETSLPAVLGLVEDHAPAAVIVDSIQTVTDPARNSAAASVAQVRESTAALVRQAKTRAAALLLVGHVTKEGAIAGPRVLEHLVDVVLTFGGDRYQALRMLRATKNRFGAAGQVGCFQMAGHGLEEVADPSRLFLTDHAHRPPGVAVTVAVEGPRPMAVEIQALTSSSRLAAPRRQTTGLDPARVALLVAVLDRRAGVRLADQDLFASPVGGVRMREPAADLATCLAVVSACRDRPLPRRLLTVGEVGLAGEVRMVPQLARRLAEGARLGFTQALVPHVYDGASSGMDLCRVRDLRGALDATCLLGKGSQTVR